MKEDEEMERGRERERRKIMDIMIT